MRIVFEVAGDKQLDREILRVGDRAVDAAPAFAAIADLWISETREQFNTQGRHGSGGWAPLSPATMMQKRGRFARGEIQHLEILRATDRLRDSLVDRGSDDMVLDIQPGSLTYGTKVPYAGFHQTGTRRMPRRRPVELTERARVESVKIMQRFIIGGGL